MPKTYCGTLVSDRFQITDVVNDHSGQVGPRITSAILPTSIDAQSLDIRRNDTVRIMENLIKIQLEHYYLAGNFHMQVDLGTTLNWLWPKF